jgi:tetratricopeptide (TPR) repeat protein
LWTTQGESYRKKGEFSNAKLCLQTALKLKQKLRHSSLAIPTYIQLGLLYFDLGDKQQAQTTLKQAVSLGEETKDNLRLMSALISLGDCYLYQGMPLKARNQYEVALVIPNTHSYELHQWDILMKLAATCEQDNPKLYRKYVEKFHQLSLKLWKGGERNMSLNERLRNSKLLLDAEPPDA